MSYTITIIGHGEGQCPKVYDEVMALIVRLKEHGNAATFAAVHVSGTNNILYDGRAEHPRAIVTVTSEPT